MAKKTYEKGAKDRFLRHIERERGETWQVFAKDFVTDPGTGRNFDYQLAFGSGRIALEIMELIKDGRSRAQSEYWGKIASAIVTELMRRIRKDKDIIVWTPPYFSVSKMRWKQFVLEVADKLESVARSCTREGKVRIHGYSYTVRSWPGSGHVRLTCSPPCEIFDIAGQILSALRQKLPDKNRQLSVASHERIILLVGSDETIRTEDVRESISNIDFSCVPNIDKVYFDAGLEQIHLVYDRGGKATWDHGIDTEKNC